MMEARLFIDESKVTILRGSNMSERDWMGIAAVVASLDGVDFAGGSAQRLIGERLADHFAATVHGFDGGKFLTACGQETSNG